jgi:pimeloyl-ACP methyl ester carboxylesterase
MSATIRRRYKIGLFLVCGAVAAFAIFVWFAAGQLVQPPRGHISEYHREWLLHPEAHGMRIMRDAASGGEFPYLLVEPDSSAGPGARGVKVREQIAAMGIQPPPFGEVIGTLVLLHGRTGRKDAMLAIAERFCAAGFRCVIPDLPAQGESPLKVQTFGARSFESALPSVVLVDAAGKYGFAPAPAGVFGMSMGGAYAISAASKHPDRWRAVVLLSTFDSLPLVIRARARRLVGPLSTLCVPLVEEVSRRRSGVSPTDIVPARWANAITAPTMVVHGTVDPLFPSELGKRLYNAIGSREKRWLEVEGGSHDRVLTTPMPLYATMSAWFLQWMAAVPDTTETDAAVAQ